MPYGIRKSPVHKKTGKKYSKKTIPRERAESQRRAIYASENGYRLKRSRSRSLRGGNRFKRSLRSLREKLRENEQIRKNEIFLKKQKAKYDQQKELLNMLRQDNVIDMEAREDLYWNIRNGILTTAEEVAEALAAALAAKQAATVLRAKGAGARVALASEQNYSKLPDEIKDCNLFQF